MSVKASMPLTEDEEAFARELVRSGRFSSLSAVLQHDLEMVRRETEAQEAEVEALRAVLHERREGRSSTSSKGAIGPGACWRPTPPRMATYRVRRSLATDRDLALIADFLFEAYVGFGEHPEDAFARRKVRLEAIEELMLAFAEQPHRAIPRDDVLPGRRMLTRDRVLLGFDTTRPIARFASSARS